MQRLLQSEFNFGFRWGTVGARHVKFRMELDHNIDINSYIKHYFVKEFKHRGDPKFELTLDEFTVQ
jgi:hypothetical protein